MILIERLLLLKMKILNHLKIYINLKKNNNINIYLFKMIHSKKLKIKNLRIFKIRFKLKMI